MLSAIDLNSSHDPVSKDSFKLLRRLREESALSVSPGRGAFFNLSWLAKLGWAAAIVESDHGPKPPTFYEAIAKRGGGSGISHDIGIENPKTFSFCMHKSDFDILKTKHVQPSYVVVPLNLSFVFVSDSDFFWGLAGPQTFVESAISKKLSDATADFKEDILSYLKDPTFQKSGLAELFDAYAQTASKAIHQ